MTDSSTPRTVLVTGGASGIGLAIVARLAREGVRTVSLDLEAAPEASISIVGDVREPADHARAVEVALSETGRLDGLVANAGVHDGGLGLDVDPWELRDRMLRVIDVDVVGYALAIQAAAPALREAEGRIVLTLSDASYLVGQQGAGVAYTAAKHAALGLLGWAARELAPQVQVNAVAPGGIVTGLRAVQRDTGPQPAVFTDPEGAGRSIRARNPLGAMLTADQVAEYYHWLIVAPVPGLTGQVLRPDGGLVVR